MKTSDCIDQAILTVFYMSFTYRWLNGTGHLQYIISSFVVAARRGKRANWP
jgi:hypothetical protein